MPAEGRRLRLVHVIPEDGTGGVEVAARSMQARRDLACDATVFAILDGPGVARLGWTQRLGLLSWRNLRAYRAAFRALRVARADVLVFSLWKTVPLLLLARLFLRARIVYFLHLERPMHPVDDALSRLAMRVADAVWADCGATLIARRVPPAKPTRVISFVTERLHSSDARVPAPRFVSWGRLNAQKGIDRAIELIALLRARGLAAEFHAYGHDDGARETLVAQAERLGVADHVHFPGPIPADARGRVGAGAGFFLQLSRFEGMCMGAVEGMQLGLVPVATAVGQMADYVRDGVTGLIVDPNRLPAAADAIAALLDDPERYRAMSQAVRRRWLDAPLYADDVCQAAGELAAAPMIAAIVRVAAESE